MGMKCTTKRATTNWNWIDTGEMSYSAIQREIVRIFDVNFLQLGLMRIDLAAGVVSVPVRWPASNARVR